jgi:hypothetical protein
MSPNLWERACSRRERLGIWASQSASTRAKVDLTLTIPSPNARSISAMLITDADLPAAGFTTSARQA